MTTACFDTCEDCIDYAAALQGSWSPIGMGVGPNRGDEGWWSYPRDGSRGCWEDDVFEFKADGTFTMDLGADTWLEGWQGVDEGCGAPVAPHVSADHTYTFDASAMELTVNGDGAYVVLAKAHNTGEDGNSGGSIMYHVTSLTETEMILDLNYGNWWRLYLKKN